jgi:hypothetical protein
LLRRLLFSLLIVSSACSLFQKEPEPVPVAKPTVKIDPNAKVPPEDVWSSMRDLNKARLRVDTALVEKDTNSIGQAALEVAREIQAFPDKYDALPPDFLSLADMVEAKAKETAQFAQKKDIISARASWGEVLQACKNCHVVWKGPTYGYELLD